MSKNPNNSPRIEQLKNNIDVDLTKKQERRYINIFSHTFY